MKVSMDWLPSLKGCGYNMDTNGNFYNKKDIIMNGQLIHAKGVRYSFLDVCGKQKKFYGHRLVLRRFGNGDGSYDDNTSLIVNHLDGDKSNNKIYNLKWGKRNDKTKPKARVKYVTQGEVDTYRYKNPGTIKDLSSIIHDIKYGKLIEGGDPYFNTLVIDETSPSEIRGNLLYNEDMVIAGVQEIPPSNDLFTEYNLQEKMSTVRSSLLRGVIIKDDCESVDDPDNLNILYEKFFSDGSDTIHVPMAGEKVLDFWDFERNILMTSSRYDPLSPEIAHWVCKLSIHGKMPYRWRASIRNRVNDRDIGCPGCFKIHRELDNNATDYFVRQAEIKHNYRYDYTKTSVRHNNEWAFVTIICSTIDPESGLEHGEFEQLPILHLGGVGICPKCNSLRVKSGSKRQKDIVDYLTEQSYREGSNMIFEWSDKVNLRNKYPLRIDIYLVSENLLIEIDGKQHFQPIEYFGGKETFLNVVQRDFKKDVYALTFDMNFLRLPYSMSLDDAIGVLRDTIFLCNIGKRIHRTYDHMYRDIVAQNYLPPNIECGIVSSPGLTF
tara:strand:- start:722 stop:2371 length:1650 start_codon:yes stop_codon:yes gene_type:complete